MNKKLKSIQTIYYKIKYYEFNNPQKPQKKSQNKFKTNLQQNNLMTGAVFRYLAAIKQIILKVLNLQKKTNQLKQL